MAVNQNQPHNLVIRKVERLYFQRWRAVDWLTVTVNCYTFCSATRLCCADAGKHWQIHLFVIIWMKTRCQYSSLHDIIDKYMAKSLFWPWVRYFESICHTLSWISLLNELCKVKRKQNKNTATHKLRAWTRLTLRRLPKPCYVTALQCFSVNTVKTSAAPEEIKV